jgi:hypothetical protein
MTPDETIDVLMQCHRDIGEWIQLAERQRREIPNADYVPHAPNSMGIKRSRQVQEIIGRAVCEIRAIQSLRASQIESSV